MKPTYERGGVMPCAITDTGQIFFVPGEDISGDFSDWGGQIKSTDDNIYATASRELEEESFGCITVEPEVLKGCVALCYDKCVIFLVPFTFNYLMNAIAEFSRACPFHMRNGKVEMNGIKILFQDDFIKCLQDGKFYTVVTAVLRSNFDKLPIYPGCTLFNYPIK
jgi:hypothetical protein